MDDQSRLIREKPSAHPIDPSPMRLKPSIAPSTETDTIKTTMPNDKSIGPSVITSRVLSTKPRGKSMSTAGLIERAATNLSPISPILPFRVIEKSHQKSLLHERSTRIQYLPFGIRPCVLFNATRNDEGELNWPSKCPPSVPRRVKSRDRSREPPRGCSRNTAMTRRPSG